MSNKQKQYKSDAFAAIHETARALKDINAIDKKTMANFDASCLSEVTVMKPEDIKQLREREHVSQPVFATYLSVSKNLVSDWERGIKKPGGPALRLLSLIKRKGLDVLT